MAPSLPPRPWRSCWRPRCSSGEKGGSPPPCAPPAYPLKILGTFDLTFQPSIDRAQILSLHELGFVQRKENVIFLGPAGVGKAHLAISLAVAATEKGRRVYYSTIADLVLSLVEAER